VELHDVHGETEIIITHEPFLDPAVHGGHTIGWNCSLERLTQLLEVASLHRTLVTHGRSVPSVSHPATGQQASQDYTFYWTAERNPVE
jgi:hypothetical protein